MERREWLVAACLLGALMVAALMGGLRGRARAAASASARDVVINEVAWMGTDAGYEYEWLELYNTTSDQIDLQDWTLSDSGGPLAKLTGTIPAGGYYLLAKETATFTSTEPQIDQLFSGSLRNDGEVITLTDSSSVTVDTANAERGYDNNWAAGSNTEPKRTMERIDPTAPDTDDNWATNDGVIRNGFDADGDPINGTPKRRNSASTADLIVKKSAPDIAIAGSRISYTIRLRNAGKLTAASARLTDALPSGVSFYTYTSVYTLHHPTSDTLFWEIDAMPPSTNFFSITVWADADKGLSGVVTNVVTATTATAEYTKTNNAARAPTEISQPRPDLSIAKRGPDAVTAGDLITYRISLSNTGQISATAVRVTDTLPSAVYTLTQIVPSPHQQQGRDLVWQLGDVPTGTRRLVTITGRLTDAISGTVTNTVTATTADDELTTANNTDVWTTTVRPEVLIYALAPANYGDSDEAAALINLSPYTASVGGWWLNDEPVGGGIRLLNDTNVSPGEILWLAKDADGFRDFWGFEPDRASSAYWPGFTDHGEAAYLLDDEGKVVDALAYGDGAASTGWITPPVPYKYAGYGDGQVLYRKLDQSTGLPVADTDTAADWAQDPADPINGRKLRYPGWDLETFFFPAVATPTAPITLAAAPDGAFELVSDTLGAARESILIEGYTFESAALYEVLEDRLEAGVTVTMLLEGYPVGWFGEDRKNGLWVAERIHEHPNGAVYFMYDDATRYPYQHAKFAVVDGETALVSTENFNPSAMPSDRKENGTMGHRGFAAAARSPGVVDRLQPIFAHDLDLAHHVDLAPYGAALFDLDLYDPYFTPLPEPDWTTYTATFSEPLATTASDFTVVQAPENALHDRDALLGLLNRSGEGNTIAAMQLNEPYTWTKGTGEAGLNPRVQALVAAAQNGASVRLLLDDFYDDGDNDATCRILNAIAAREGLSITCRLGNPTGSGVHAKAFAASIGDERWVHLGSINGSENANKRNREVALQFSSPAAYDWMLSIFDHDWAQAHAPYVAHLYLPLVARDYKPPVDYPLISEVFVNPGGSDSGGEWIEIYNPGDTVSIAGWSLGDAISAGDYGDGRYSFPEGAQILHGQVIVVAQCAEDFGEAQGWNPQYELAICPEGYSDDEDVPNLAPAGNWEGFGLALGNTEDEVLLKADGSVVDSAAWNGEQRAGVVPYPMDPGSTFPWDASLKRYPPDSDRDDCSRDLYVSYNPSPGLVASD